jgi:hypothetical protein
MALDTTASTPEARLLIRRLQVRVLPGAQTCRSVTCSDCLACFLSSPRSFFRWQNGRTGSHTVTRQRPDRDGLQLQVYAGRDLLPAANVGSAATCRQRLGRVEAGDAGNASRHRRVRGDIDRSICRAPTWSRSASWSRGPGHLRRPPAPARRQGRPARVLPADQTSERRSRSWLPSSVRATFLGRPAQRTPHPTQRPAASWSLVLYGSTA